MPKSTQWNKLKDAVDRFRVQLEEEVAADDQDAIQRWCGSVREAFDELDELLSSHRQRVHAKLFREAENREPAESENIRQLKKADKQIAGLLDVVKSQLIALHMQTVPDVEPRVENADQDDGLMQEIIDRGQELTHWIFEQEASVTIWYAETFVDE